MDTILARVGEAELRQHCEAAVLDELQKSNGRVQDVVAALQRALKVARASQELHKTLVLNASEQVQVSFRQLGESCNQIGPLLRLMHHPMGSTASATSESVAAVAIAPVAAAAQSETKLAPPASPTSSTATVSEYELPSDEEDDEPEVVEVSPPKKSKKRKAVTLDLSEAPTPEEDTQTVREQLAEHLTQIQAIPPAKYSVAMHKEFAGFPRGDPALAQLLHEMETHVAAFKESIAQNQRVETLSKWQQDMTVSPPVSTSDSATSASAFVPTVDLTSIPPKLDTRLNSLNVSRCKNEKELQALAKLGNQLWNKFRGDVSSPRQKKATYFEPLLVTTTRFYAAAAATDNSVLGKKGASLCNNNLRMLSMLATGVTITREECELLEWLLHAVRVVMQKNVHCRKKAVSLISDLLELFPASARPSFVYPGGKQTQKQKNKKRKKAAK